jgi:hypothetical protein
MMFKSSRFIVLFYGLTLIAALVAYGPVTTAFATAFEDPGARMAEGALNGSGLEPVKTEVDGGELTVGSKSQVVVLFRNTLAQTVEVGAVTLYPSSTVTANVSLNDCAKEPLSPGAECAMAVEVTALQTGSWRIEMLIRHSGRTKIVTATMRGTVSAGTDSSQQLRTDLQPIPDKIEFGTLETGKPLVRSIVMRNVASTPITIKDVAVQASSNAEYNLETNCEKLMTGQACLISLSWTPSQKGPSEGFIVIKHDGSTGISSIPITGEYEPEEGEKAPLFPPAVPGKGLLVSSVEDVDFGKGVANEAAITLSLVNVGDADLEIQQLNLSGADNGMSIVRKGCTPGRVLAPVEACPLTIAWSPLRSGDVRDDLQIIHDGARGVLVLPIKGGATAAISKDTKSIVERDGVETRPVDRSQVLQGYVVSSHAPTRAIIVGAGGSRVVKDGQDLVLGGVTWKVNIVPSGVEMIDGSDKILLLFDRSLSTGSRLNTTGSTSGTGSTTTTTPATSSGGT